MFTRIGKIILWAGIFFGAIGSLIGGINYGRTIDSFWIGLLITLAGWVLVIIAFTLFGIIIEISSNLEKILRFSGSIPQDDEEDDQDQNDLETDDQDSFYKYDETEDFWFCPDCKNQNMGETIFCVFCGFKRVFKD